MTAISFYISAVVAVGAALFGVSTREPRRALAGFGVAFAALVVPLQQLRAPLVAALLLLCAGSMLALLGALARIPRAPASSDASGSSVVENAKFWVPASVGLAGFVWSLLAAGSRQVISAPPALDRRHVNFGAGDRVLEVLAGEHLVASAVVGLLALCCVIAAVVTLVGEGEGQGQGQDRASRGGRG